ncbi:hypothetical protein QOT17_011545 [Balamuthia mandrillaris]
MMKRSSSSLSTTGVRSSSLSLWLLWWLLLFLSLWLLSSCIEPCQARRSKSSGPPKRFLWKNVAVDISLTPEGDLDVVERHLIDFYQGTFRFGYRKIPFGYGGRNDGIERMHVFEGSKAYEQLHYPRSGDEGSEPPFTFKVVDEGYEKAVYWYFPQTTGQHEYTFQYRVRKAVRVGLEDGSNDELFWKVIPANHPAPIESTHITIHLPPSFRLLFNEEYITEAPNNNLDGNVERENELLAHAFAECFIGGEEINVARPEIGGAKVTLSPERDTVSVDVRKRLKVDEMLEVRLLFEPKYDGRIPLSNWQRSEQESDVLALILYVIVFIVVALPWYLVYHFKLPVIPPAELGGPAPHQQQIETSLPDASTPAEAGTMLTHRVAMKEVMATLVDLSRRGYLLIHEFPDDYYFQRPTRTSTSETEQQPQQRNTTSYRHRSPPRQRHRSSPSSSNHEENEEPEAEERPLTPYEEALLSLVADHRLSELKYKFKEQEGNFAKMVYQSLVQRNIYWSDPRPVINRLVLSGILLIAVDIWFWFAGYDHFLVGLLLHFPSLYLLPRESDAFFDLQVLSKAIFHLTIAVGLCGVELLILPELVVRTLTREGVKHRHRWQLFRNYLRELSDRSSDAFVPRHFDAIVFEEYLPYAIAFGMEGPWVQRWEAVATSAAPAPPSVHPSPSSVPSSIHPSPSSVPSSSQSPFPEAFHPSLSSIPSSFYPSSSAPSSAPSSSLPFKPDTSTRQPSEEQPQEQEPPMMAPAWYILHPPTTSSTSFIHSPLFYDIRTRRYRHHNNNGGLYLFHPTQTTRGGQTSTFFSSSTSMSFAQRMNRMFTSTRTVMRTVRPSKSGGKSGRSSGGRSGGGGSMGFG